MAEKMIEAHEDVEELDVGLVELEETIGYLKDICGGERPADEMLAKIEHCMRNAQNHLAKAHSPGSRDKIMRQYNRCIEKAIGEHVPSSALKDRLTIVGGVTATFAMLGSALPGPGTAAGAVVGAIVGAIAGAVVGTTIDHKMPVDKSHQNKIRDLLHEGKLDKIIGSKKTGGGIGRLGSYLKKKKRDD
ncbi:MAG: hypothetical protein ABIG39_07905 [Candidatus Micrarchaeota archaeon]